MKIGDFIKDAGEMVFYSRGLAECLGRNAATLLCRLIWWKRTADREEWVERSMAEIEEATTLSAHEQRLARKRLTDIGILVTRVDKRDHKTFYMVDQDRLHAVWEEHIEGAGVRNALPGGQVYETNEAGVRNQSAARASSIRERINKNDGGPSSPSIARGFFGAEGDKEETFASKASKRLERHIRETRKLMRTPSRARWERTFTELVVDVGNDQERVKRVLLWYIHHHRLPKMVTVHSADDFRRKFSRIEERMEWEEGKVTEDTPTSQEQGVIDRLSRHDWPRGTGGAELSASVVRSMRRHAAMVQARRRMLEQRSPLPQDGSLPWEKMDLMFRTLFRPTPEFIYDWYVRLNSRFRGWSGWTGVFEPWEFHVDGKVFRMMATERHGAQLWDRYFSVVREHMTKA